MTVRPEDQDYVSEEIAGDISFTQGNQYYAIVRSTCINKKFRSHSSLQFRTNSAISELLSMLTGK